MRVSLKVPAFVALAVVGLTACGSDAESAPDLESSEYEEMMEEQGATASDGQVAAEPPAAVPPATRPPATPPAQSTTPPPVAPPEERVETEAEAETEVEEAVVTIPAGSRIEAGIQSEISTRNASVDDLVEARVSQDVIGSDGSVVVPEGSIVLGRVAESSRSSGSDNEAVLVLTFHALRVGDRQFPIRASVVEVDLDASSKDSDARTAAKIATGTAVGAIVGQILGGDRRSTIAGAAAGAAAGTGIALTTRDGHAVLPEGARLVLQIDEPAVVPHVR